MKMMEENNQTPTLLVSPSKPKNWLLVIVSVLVVLSFGTTAFLSWQNYQLRKQLIKQKAEIPLKTEIPQSLLDRSRAIGSEDESYGFYFVELPGPTKSKWLAELKGDNVEILQYYSPYKYLVRMTTKQSIRIERLDFVVSIVPYETEVPQTLLDRSGIIEYVSILIYDDKKIDGTLNSTIKTIQALGGTHVDQEAPRRTIPAVVTIFTLPASKLQAVAEIDNVISMNYRVPHWPLE